MRGIELYIAQVRGWIAGVRQMEGEVGEIDVRAYVKKTWPGIPGRGRTKSSAPSSTE